MTTTTGATTPPEDGEQPSRYVDALLHTGRIAEALARGRGSTIVDKNGHGWQLGEVVARSPEHIEVTLHRVGAAALTHTVTFKRVAL